MNSKAIDLHDVILAQEKALRRTLGDTIALEHQSVKPGPRAAVAESMIVQALTGLLENARKGMPGGGKVDLIVEQVEVDETHARIHRGARRGEFVRLTVADNGQGLHTEQLRRLMEQLPPLNGSRPGAGLPMPLISGMIRRCGGWMEAHSQMGGGTTMHVYLPTELAVVNRPHLPGARETILLVDDEFVVRRMVKNALERAGYEVFEAETGNAALAVWDQHKEHVDLLLTDMVMPDGLTGRALAKRLVAEKPKLHVVYTSGYELDADSLRDTETGLIRFLHKPYDMRGLLETVHLAMNDTAATATPEPTSHA